MMGPRLVLDRILDELETRNADRVERKVVGSTGVTHGKRGHAQVPEGLHPCFEDWRHGFVFLHVHAADLPRTIVHVKVSSNFRLLWLYGNRARFTTDQRWHPPHLWFGHGRPRSKMLLYVILRP